MLFSHIFRMPQNNKAETQNCHLFLSIFSHFRKGFKLVAITLSFFVGFSSIGYSSGMVAGRVLVQPKGVATEASVQSAFKAAGAKEIARLHQINVRVLQGPARAEKKVIDALSKNPNFNFAEPDYIGQAILVPNDPYYSSHLWHLPKISAPGAWDITTGSPSVMIAVVDTGVDPSHSDLIGRVVAGYDFANGDTDPFDDNGHGTAGAGTAAAMGNNGIGVTGVAWNVCHLASQGARSQWERILLRYCQWHQLLRRQGGQDH
jgi:subtilisin family serine protease